MAAECAVPTREHQALFALIQGGMFADLRRQAARAAAADDPPGFAIGGLSVGEPKLTTFELLEATLEELPARQPRYLMGVGHPLDLSTYARLGIDLFDCVLPTRLARNGAVWTDRVGHATRPRQTGARRPPGPIVEDCLCSTCRDWPLGVVAALFQSSRTARIPTRQHPQPHASESGPSRSAPIGPLHCLNMNWRRSSP